MTRLRVLGLAALAGCGAAPTPLVDPAPPDWTEASLSPEPALLRRSHAAGDRLVSCVTGEERVRAGTAAATEIAMYAAITDVEIVEAAANGPFAARFASSVATGLVGGPGVVLDVPAPTELVRFDARNRPLVPAAPTSPAPSSGAPIDHTTLPLIPDFGVLFDPSFPETALAQGEAFEHASESTIYEDGAPPVRSELTVRWTHLGIEVVGDVRYAHLGCTGTYEMTFDVTAPTGDERAIGRTVGTLACQARFDLATGFVGDVRIVTRSRATSVHTRSGEPREETDLLADTEIDLTRVANVAIESVPRCVRAQGILEARR